MAFRRDGTIKHGARSNAKIPGNVGGRCVSHSAPETELFALRDIFFAPITGEATTGFLGKAGIRCKGNMLQRA